MAEVKKKKIDLPLIAYIYYYTICNTWQTIRYAYNYIKNIYPCHLLHIYILLLYAIRGKS